MQCWHLWDRALHEHPPRGSAGGGIAGAGGVAGGARARPGAVVEGGCGPVADGRLRARAGVVGDVRLKKNSSQ